MIWPEKGVTAAAHQGLQLSGLLLQAGNLFGIVELGVALRLGRHCRASILELRLRRLALPVRRSALRLEPIHVLGTGASFGEPPEPCVLP